MGLDEKPPTMMTNCLAIAFTLNRRYSKASRHAVSTVDQNTRTFKTCVRLFRGMQLQHKWSKHHKYLLATVDVKNLHLSFSDLENKCLSEESNDQLLDQAWDDHTGTSLDAKKVKEARQLEMEYYDKMHVFDKVPCVQCWERTGKAPLKAR